MPKRKSAMPLAEPEKPYELTAADLKLRQEIAERRRGRPPAPRMKLVMKDSELKLAIDIGDNGVWCDRVLMALGLSDDCAAQAAVYSLLSHFAPTVDDPNPSAAGVNGALAMVREIGPRDAIECMLACQMVAAHFTAMKQLDSAARENRLDPYKAKQAAAQKLLGRFAAHVETLKRYRSKGEQKVIVQHQHLNVAANQAQVNVNAGGVGASSETKEQPYEQAAVTHASEPAMSCEIEAIGAAVPIAGGDGA